MLWSEAVGLASPVPALYDGAHGVSIAEIAANLRRRQEQRRTRARQRAARFRASLPAARELLCARLGAGQVWVFGSLARGDARETSDVDLAVEGLAPERYFSALADLMALFGGPVDLVRIEEASPSLTQRIRDEGQAL